MKKNLFTFFGALAFFASTFPALAQIEQTRQASGFNSIASSSSFNVHVKIDGTETVKVIADESIINDVETVVEKGELKIRIKKDHWSSYTNKKADVYVTAKSLSSLTNSGSGSIELNGSLTGDAQLRSSGSGNIHANASGGNLQVSVSGSGNVTSAVNASEITASVSGSGKINLEGKAREASVRVSGSGKINADDLKTETANVSVSGSGKININAEKTISGSISGSGGLNYTGNATEVNIKKSGSGRVRKI